MFHVYTPITIFNKKARNLKISSFFFLILLFILVFYVSCHHIENIYFYFFFKIFFFVKHMKILSFLPYTLISHFF